VVAFHNHVGVLHLIFERARRAFGWVTMGVPIMPVLPIVGHASIWQGVISGVAGRRGDDPVIVVGEVDEIAIVLAARAIGGLIIHRSVSRQEQVSHGTFPNWHTRIYKRGIWGKE